MSILGTKKVPGGIISWFAQWGVYYYKMEQPKIYDITPINLDLSPISGQEPIARSHDHLPRNCVYLYRCIKLSTLSDKQLDLRRK